MNASACFLLVFCSGDNRVCVFWSGGGCKVLNGTRRLWLKVLVRVGWFLLLLLLLGGMDKVETTG